MGMFLSSNYAISLRWTSVEEELMFKILFILIYAAFAGVRVYYRSQNLGRTSEKEFNKITKSIVALTIAILGYFASMILWILLPQAIALLQLALPALIRWIGVFVSVIGVALLFWVHHTLGRQYSARLEIQELHQLITAGPYSRVRHPMYTIFILFSLSVSLISANLLFILFAVFLSIPFHWITRIEESLLIDQFGEEYLEYMKRTGRFIPSIS
ncbi:isoprenylcysteine carboxylmethyltransferase family protein [Candidatus Thorarchaeota archaeon]|nr:MAG: isoprenylcysteine carboxylmethyltransferase family protein [Candidatus Thorarchaeota archaeon]